MNKIVCFGLGVLAGIVLTFLGIAIAVMIMIAPSKEKIAAPVVKMGTKVSIVSTSANTSELTNIIAANKKMLPKPLSETQVVFSAEGEYLKMQAAVKLFGEKHNLTGEFLPTVEKNGILKIKVAKLQLERLPLTAPGIIDMVAKQMMEKQPGITYDEKTKTFVIDTKVYESHGISFTTKKIDMKKDIIEIEILQRVK